MDFSIIQMLLDHQLTHPQPSTKEVTENREAIAKDIYSQLSLDNDAFINFYQLLTYSTEMTASRDGVIQGYLLRFPCPLDNGRHDNVIGISQDTSESNTSAFGSLGFLPLEILQDIMENDLDLLTLTTLRRVNRGIRATIDSMSKYRTVIHHVPNSIRAILSIKVANAISCRDIWVALTSKECVTCQRFGSYLYLPTCTRVCYGCCMESPHCLPLELADATNCYLVTKGDLLRNGVGIAESLPGRYYNTAQTNLVSLVDRSAAARVASVIFNLKGDVYQVIRGTQLIQARRQCAELELWADSPIEEVPRRLLAPSYGQPSSYTDVAWKNHNRRMCVTTFPWLDRSNREKHGLEMGVSCRGCLAAGDTPIEFPIIYSDNAEDMIRRGRVSYSYRDYISHFTRCQNSLAQWLRYHDEQFPVQFPLMSSPELEILPGRHAKCFPLRILTCCGSWLEKLCYSTFRKGRRG